MNFFRYYLIIFLIVVYSCSKNENDITQLNFWAMGTEGEYVQKLITDFDLANRKIKVKIQKIPWSAAQEKLITAYASDNLPDIFQLGNTWIPQFKALNAIENLDNLLVQSRDINKNNYFDGIWDTNIIENSLYGIPWYIDTRILYYRTDVLKKAGFNSPPKTWNELYRVSKKIKSINRGVEKYAIFLPTNDWANFIIFGLHTGATFLKDNNTIGNFSDAKYKKAFEYLLRFHKENLSPLSISQVPNVYQAFAQEYFSMYISGPWNINEFKKWMTGDLADKWMTAPLPGLTDSIPGYSLAGGSSLVISRNSNRKKEAWQLIEYLSDPEIQIDFYKLIYNLPAIKEAWQDPLMLNNPYMPAFYKQFQYVKATPKIPEWEQIAFSKLLQYFELTARGVMSSDDALQKLDGDVYKILEKRRWLLSRNK